VKYAALTPRRLASQSKIARPSLLGDSAGLKKALANILNFPSYCRLRAFLSGENVKYLQGWTALFTLGDFGPFWGPRFPREKRGTPPLKSPRISEKIRGDLNLFSLKS